MSIRKNNVFRSNKRIDILLLQLPDELNDLAYGKKSWDNDIDIAPNNIS